MPNSRPSVNPYLAIAFGILAVSTAAVFIRYAQAYAPSLVIAAYRLCLAALLLAPEAILKRRQELARLTSRQAILACLSGLFLAFHFATWISSLEYTSVASSVVLVTTTPLWVALLSPFTLKEPIRRLAILGMILALAGSAIVGLSDSCTWGQNGMICSSTGDLLQDKAVFGDVLAVCGALAAAAYMIIGRKLRENVSLGSYIFVVYGMAALFLLLIVLGSGQSMIGYPPQAYLWFALLALFPQLLGHSIFNWALRYISAAYVSITMLGEPIGSTILAYFLLHETPASLKIFGAILILFGIFVASQSEGPSKSIQGSKAQT